jgi:ParB family chromosome partitioning protein
LPLDDSAPDGTAALDGRRRLAGAYFIAIDRIRPDPAQPRRRLDTDAHRELTLSVRQLGVMQPIAVRWIDAEGVYRIISGERRYHAAMAAELAEVPCWVQTPREEEILLRQIVENWQRSDLSPFELADSLAAIRDSHGYSQDELAALTGKPKSEISKLLALLNLSADAQQLARADPSLSRRHLYAISQSPPEEHAKLIEQVREHGLKANETEALVKRRAQPAAHGRQVTIRRFRTTQAVVTLTFRKRSVTESDLYHALDEVRGQLQQEHVNPRG